MKSTLIFTRICVMTALTIIYGCGKESADKSTPRTAGRDTEKSDSIIPLGCIRGYFGNEYRTFTQHIEQVAPIDSFSNCYFYGCCNNTLKQINLIRCDSTYVIAMYIIGFSPDSLPAGLPVTPEFCKYTEIQYYKFSDWNNISSDTNYYHYRLDDFYGNSVFIANNTDDVLTGTFEGDLISTSGKVLHVSDGEFKLKIFRKYMPCGPNGGK